MDSVIVGVACMVAGFVMGYARRKNNDENAKAKIGGGGIKNPSLSKDIGGGGIKNPKK